MAKSLITHGISCSKFDYLRVLTTTGAILSISRSFFPFFSVQFVFPLVEKCGCGKILSQETLTCPSQETLIKKPIRKSILASRLGASQEHSSMYLSHVLDNKKKISAPALVLTLLFSAVAGTLFVNYAVADVNALTVTLQSPEDRIYGTNEVPVVFTYAIDSVDSGVRIGNVEDALLKDPAPRFKYYLDGGSAEFSANRDGYSCTTVLNLPEGDHYLSIGVWAGWNDQDLIDYSPDIRFSGRGFSKVVHFVVDTSPLTISVLSVKPSASYNTSVLPLSFAVYPEPVSASYSLDGHANVTVAGFLKLSTFFGNATLSGLSDGEHTVRVYATDRYGATAASPLINFGILTQEPEQSEPVQAGLIAVGVVVSGVMIAFGLVAYLLRRKSKRRRNVA